MHIQWKYLDIQYQSSTGLFDLTIGKNTVSVYRVNAPPGGLPLKKGDPIPVTPVIRAYALEIVRNVPVDNIDLKFVRSTNYRLRFIVHPRGGADGRYGNAMQIVCEQCGTAYPFNWSMSPTPCGMCAVERHTGIILSWRDRRWVWTRKV